MTRSRGGRDGPTVCGRARPALALSAAAALISPVAGCFFDATPVPPDAFRMLQQFLSVPVATSKNTTPEAYQLAWRPVGARKLSLAKAPQAPQGAPKKKAKK